MFIKGKTSWNKGIPNTPEQKIKISMTIKGRLEVHPILGYTKFP